MISERTGQQQELRRQLAQTEQELCELRRDKERDEGGEMDHLRRLLKEKEAFIKVSGQTSCLLLFLLLCLHDADVLHQELIQGQDEAVQKETEAEMKALKEDMQLVLKKEIEAQVFTCLDLEMMQPQRKETSTLQVISQDFLSLQKEISALRSSLEEAKDGTDHQVGFSYLFVPFKSDQLPE